VLNSKASKKKEIDKSKSADSFKNEKISKRHCEHKNKKKFVSSKKLLLCNLFEKKKQIGKNSNRILKLLSGLMSSGSVKRKSKDLHKLRLRGS
jgi:hypothetical protein